MKYAREKLLFLYLLLGHRYTKFFYKFRNEIENVKNGEEIFKLVKSFYKKDIKFSAGLEKAKRSMEIILKKLESNVYSLFSIYDEIYPLSLKNIHVPPPLIFYRGDISLLNKEIVAVVGTRNFTYYGRMVSLKLSELLSKNGICVISGLARGIDRFSHMGGLKYEGGTIAVLGNGIDVFYPAENRELQKKIFERGLVISEFLPAEPPYFYNFPIRNRIISGLSSLVVVVEAGLRSGTMITVNYALEQGKDVVVVPGSIFSKVSKGTNKLIQDGAYPLISIDEILNFVKIKNFKKGGEDKININLTEEEEKVYKLILKEGSISIDILVDMLRMDIPEISGILFSLELKGLVGSNGDRYKIKEYLN